MEENIEHCEKGSRYIREGINVLHLQGSYYEMGYQHGVLLKEQIKKGAF
ncbi:MAG: peptidase C45, partial [Armatimonadetes bacterium CG07_land_8_20_14_0_80_40_9]